MRHSKDLAAFCGMLVLVLSIGSGAALAEPMYEFSPRDGATVGGGNGIVEITIKVLDDVFFARIKDIHCTIEGYDPNGDRYIVDTLSIPQGQVPNPIVFTWDTDAKKIPDGQYNLSIQVLGDDGDIDPQNQKIVVIDDQKMGSVHIRNHEFPNDHKPPSVRFTWPAPGSNVKGMLEFKYVADDKDDSVDPGGNIQGTKESGIDFVQIFLVPDLKNPVNTVYTKHPGPLTWDSRQVKDDHYVMVIKATDFAGNASSTNDIVNTPGIVTGFDVVNNKQLPAPPVNIERPRDATVSGKFTVTGNITDPRAKWAAFSVPWTNLATQKLAVNNLNELSAEFNTKDTPDGTYTLRMEAWDTYGGSMSFDDTTITIDNATAKASSVTRNDDPAMKWIAITEPKKDEPVGGTKKVRVGLAEDIDFSYVNFSDAQNRPLFIGPNGPNIFKGQGPYEVDWDTTKWPDGPVTLQARLFDGDGVMATDSVKVNISNNGQPQMIRPPQNDGGVEESFSDVRLGDEDLGDISRSVPMDDLKGKQAVLSGTLKQSPGLDHLEVSLDGGLSWQKIEPKPRWSYSFEPVADRDYDIKFRTVQKDGSTADVRTPKARFHYTRSANKGSEPPATRSGGASAVDTGRGRDTSPWVTGPASSRDALSDEDKDTADTGRSRTATTGEKTK